MTIENSFKFEEELGYSLTSDLGRAEFLLELGLINSLDEAYFSSETGNETEILAFEERIKLIHSQYTDNFSFED